MKSRFRVAKYVAVGTLLVIGAGLGVREWQRSIVLGHTEYRFNLALIERDKGVTFVSFDPTEKTILTLPFPTNLAIKSRGSGEYSISSLYKLGSYKGDGGKFARQKIQGFMRVPIPGYMVTTSNLRVGLLTSLVGEKETNLSRFDMALLLLRALKYRTRVISQDELTRSGVIEGETYHPERLQEYVGSRLFDWGIGGTGLSVAIVNGSGENGLGSDMADFLTNLGLDVVMVRSVTTGEMLTQSEWQVNEMKTADELEYIFGNLFGLGKARVESVPGEYRATVLVRVGKDAKELF